MQLTWSLISIVLFVVLPGLILRRLYFYSEFSKEFGVNHSIPRLFLLGLLPGSVNISVSIAWLTLAHDSQELICLSEDYLALAGFSSDQEVTAQTVINLVSHFVPLAIITYGQAIIGGFLGGRLVRWTALDTVFKFLRFRNYWYYIFTGRHRRLKNYDHLIDHDRSHKVLLARIDALMSFEYGEWLYSGYLIDYELDEDDIQNLSKIVLAKTARKQINNNIPNDSYKLMPGSLVVLDCKSLSNLNITYYTAQSLLDADDDTAHLILELILQKEVDQTKAVRRAKIINELAQIFIYFGVGLAMLPVIFDTSSTKHTWIGFYTEMSLLLRVALAFLVQALIYRFNPYELRSVKFGDITDADLRSEIVNLMEVPEDEINEELTVYTTYINRYRLRHHQYGEYNRSRIWKHNLKGLVVLILVVAAIWFFIG